MSETSHEILKDSFFRVIKRSGIFILITNVLATALNQWITESMQEILNSPDGVGARLWFFGGLSLVTGMVIPVFQSLLILAGKSQASLWQFLAKNFKYSIIEMMRAWGKSMTWGFLFIIPGLICYVRYLFVMFVVCEDDNYSQGKVDALKRSAKLSHGIWWKLFFLLCIFNIVFPAIMTFFDDYSLLSENFVSGSLLCLIEAIIQILFVLLILRVYRKRALT